MYVNIDQLEIPFLLLCAYLDLKFSDQRFYQRLDRQMCDQNRKCDYNLIGWRNVSTTAFETFNFSSCVVCALMRAQRFISLPSNEQKQHWTIVGNGRCQRFCWFLLRLFVTSQWREIIVVLPSNDDRTMKIFHTRQNVSVKHRVGSCLCAQWMVAFHCFCATVYDSFNWFSIVRANV